MKKTFVRYWVTRCLAFVLLFGAQGCYAASVVINGVVKTESGKVVKGATLIFYEYVGKFAGMPDVKIRAVRITDRTGAYSVDLTDVSGDIEVQLVRDHCEWKDETVRVSLVELKRRGSVLVNITPREDHCE